MVRVLLLIFVLGGVLVMCSSAMAAPKVDVKDGVLPGGNLLALETYSLRELFGKGELDMLTFPAKTKELHIKGLALNDMFFKSWDEAYLTQIKDAAKAQGRVIVAFIMGGGLATGDEAARKKNIEEISRKMKVAHFLGAPVVRIDLGGTGQGQEADDTVGVERVIAGFKELLPLAKQLKIKMTIENHGGVSKSADNILRIIKGTDPKWVGSCLDFKNWPKDLFYESNEKLAPYAYHTHAKSHNFGPDGEETDISYQRVLAMLQKVHYKGPISIEWEGGGDPIVGVEKTRDLIIKYWK